MATRHSIFDEDVRIDPQDARIGVISGALSVPERAWSMVLFAQGSGSFECAYARKLADALQDLGLATLLVDLYSSAEMQATEFSSKDRVDIGLMTDRLNVATDWVEEKFADQHFQLGYVGAGAGAAAVLKAAAERSDIAAVVSCDGLPILAGKALADVTAATLLIVGERDQAVIEWNTAAYERLASAYRRELTLIPNAGHPLERDQALQEASTLVKQWFVRYLGAASLNRTHRTPFVWGIGHTAGVDHPVIP
jgi:dienelactone hydrolase